MKVKVRKFTIANGKHDWQDNEYAVAIYMALYSNEYKVWIYNHAQCAKIFGLSASAMKMMVNNFKAYMGKNRLGTSCPKMQTAFDKYKVLAKETLAKLAIEYIESKWVSSQKQINVEKYIRKIGKQAFVDFYETFEIAAKNSNRQEIYLEKLPKEWNEEGKRMRIYFSAILFKYKRQKVALELILEKSPRLNKESIEKAKNLLLIA